MTEASVEINLGQTPQKQWVTEAPAATLPAVQHEVFNIWHYWLGNPIDRYGRLARSTHVPMAVKLQMLKHPVVAMCAGYTGATLVKAEREIECRDEAKRRFFEAMFRRWEREFILQANVGIALGAIGLIKKWAFKVPEVINIDDPPVWAGRATPYIIDGFDQVHPLVGHPRFDEKNREFQGMDTQDGPIDIFFSLWLTFRKEWAFGAYSGAGRLDHAYKDWWMSEFGRDQYLIALQKQADRVVVVGYPPGVDKDGKSHQDIALDVGDKVRSGATVALPSSLYEQIDESGLETGITNVAKWSLKFLEGAATFSSFHEIDDHHAQRMTLGYFVPPQAWLNVKQSALGGPTTADVLADLAQELLMQDAADIDRHLNEYVFPAVSKANFPPTSPPVRVRTVGLAADNKEQLMAIIDGLLKSSPETVATMFDLREAMDRLEFPLRDEDETEAYEKAQTPTETPAGQAAEAPPADATATAATDVAADTDNVTPVGEPLPAWPDVDVPISASDVARALIQWEERAPEAARGLLTALNLAGEREA